MKKKIATLILMGTLFPVSAHADWVIDIFNKMVELYGINLETRNINGAQLDQLSDINRNSKLQLDLTRSMTAALTGTHQFGNQYHDANRFLWGSSSNDWQSLLTQVGNGGDGSNVGVIIKQLSNQFPIKDSLGSPNKVENDYYRMQAQTTMASRAGSQLAFDQMNQEAQTMQQLHRLIDTTADNKSAVDLNNRLAAENAMINIQQTKLLAMLVQQTAMDSQQKANRAKDSAEFFDIK